MSSSGTADNAPSEADLRAYNEGRLEPERFEQVDQWLGRQDPQEQERLVGSNGAPGSLAGAAEFLSAGTPAPFQSDLHGARRFAWQAAIGAGGMGIVELLRDEVLSRDIVVKRCRPRRPDEPLSTYLRRQQLFKREAQLTARLEHPGIVPVHDVGEGPLGEPSFTMKRLEGEPLIALIQQRREGAQLDAVQVVEIVLRVADAVGYAHRLGVVHRDIKPENIIVGSLGMVYVIDWGLAGEVGSAPTEGLLMGGSSISGSGMGTPAWMAPEQFGRVRADPRMDVFAIGGLLMAALTGLGPRDRAVAAGAREINLSPLESRLPRPLVAVARRCLALEPAARYADASALADDLRQWLAIGLTTAENPGPLARAFRTLRHSPRLSAALIGAAVTLLVFAAVQGWVTWRAREAARVEIDHIAYNTSPSDLNALRAARASVDEIIARNGEMPSAVALKVSLGKDIRDLEFNLTQEALQNRLNALARQVKVRGPWNEEVSDLRSASAACGLILTPSSLASDAQRIRESPLRIDILCTLAWLEGAEVVSGGSSSLETVVPGLIAAAAPDQAWRAVGRLLENPRVRGHDLALPDRPASLVEVGQSPAAADVVLSLFAPATTAEGAGAQPSLTTLYEERLRADPGAFWPRIAAGRAALAAPDYSSAERHALVALGTEPQSIWPHLLLAYTELSRHNYASVLSDALEGISTNPHHAELIVLRASAMSGLGNHVEAQEVLDQAGIGALLRWHMKNPVGHPIELGIDELLRVQHLTMPPGEAAWGPLVSSEAATP